MATPLIERRSSLGDISCRAAAAVAVLAVLLPWDEFLPALVLGVVVVGWVGVVHGLYAPIVHAVGFGHDVAGVEIAKRGI